MNFTHPTNMPSTWPDGTRRSTCNAFSAAYLVRGIPNSATAPGKPGPKKVLNSAGRPQATLAPAVMNNITIGPPKTAEEIATAALKKSRVERSAQPNNRYAMKAGTR